MGLQLLSNGCTKKVVSISIESEVIIPFRMPLSRLVRSQGREETLGMPLSEREDRHMG